MCNVFDGYCKVGNFSERTVEKFYVCNLSLCRWIKSNFGDKAYGKTLPAWAFCMDSELRSSLLKGYLDGDGWSYRANAWKATTVSKQLAHSVRLLAETLGYSCSVHYNSRPEKTKIEGRVVRQRSVYQVVLSKRPCTSVLVSGGLRWYPCKSVSAHSERQTVYNITVAEDHSYIVEGFIVHNCQDLSIAGKRAGLAGARSGLFME